MADLSSSIGSDAMVFSAMLDCIGECCGRTQNAVNSFNTALATLVTLTKNDAFLLKHGDPREGQGEGCGCGRALLVVPDIMAKEELVCVPCRRNMLSTIIDDGVSVSTDHREMKTSKLFAKFKKITSVAKI